jgi:hypothetical protein
MCCFKWYSWKNLVCWADNFAHWLDKRVPDALGERWFLLIDPICEKHDDYLTSALSDDC